ncbi:MAG: DUF4190 domain-containing protein [Verrucomicrobiales bacterium]|nr:DUF4190 domain-containing protein [Verrucomicrobiales bacterium]
MDQTHRPVQTSGFAIASLVLGILGLCVVPLGVGAVIFGHLSLRQIKKSSGLTGGYGIAMAGLITGYIGTLIAVAFGVILGLSIVSEQKEAAKAEEPFSLEGTVIPSFPEPGKLREVGEKGVRFYDVSTRGQGVGESMQFRVYLPPGEGSAGSLSCVLVPPAGSNLLSGLSLDGGDYHDETLPYAEAGMVVINYSIDGVVEDDEDTDEIKEAYEAFRRAGAGVINGRNAFELAKQTLPQVNPHKIFSAGHSSAGTLSLLLASHLPELAGAVAYAPICDLESDYGEFANDFSVKLQYPGLPAFMVRSSPITHTDEVDVPVFLFFAKDDERVSLEDGRSFGRLIGDRGGDSEVSTVSEGGHYNSMITDGIPRGIEWILKH